jgi:hypothetical protein
MLVGKFNTQSHVTFLKSNLLRRTREKDIGMIYILRIKYASFLLDQGTKSKFMMEMFLTYSKALRCTFLGELKSWCSSKSCIIRSVICNTVFKNKKIRAVEGQYFIVGVRVSQVHTDLFHLYSR